MNIALMSHSRKKELMVRFCIAYCGTFFKHTICATNTTGRLVAEATGLPVRLFLSHEHGGNQQIGARIVHNGIDMVPFFSDPQPNDLDTGLKYITTLCDQYNIPFTTSVATAEVLAHGLKWGDLDRCDIINPKAGPPTAWAVARSVPRFRTPPTGGAAACVARGRRDLAPATMNKIIKAPARCKAPGGAQEDLDWCDVINPKARPFTA